MTQKTVKVDIETHEKIKYLSNILNLKQSNFLADLINQIFNVGCTYSKANITYYPSISGSYVTCQLSGRNRLISGSNKSMSEDDLEAKIETQLLGSKNQKAVAVN